MDELIDAALAVSTLPLTILLGVVGIYWLTVMVGLLDIDMFDSDMDLDSDGLVGQIFGFGDAPFMLGFSLAVGFSWMLAVPLEHLLHLNGAAAWLGLGASVVGGYLLAKLAAVPLSRVFRHFNMEKDVVDSIEGQLCTLLYDTNSKVTSQGRIHTNSSPVEINVRARPGQELTQGSKVLVIEKADAGNYYFVETIEELER
jgi:hypothetical protein